MNATWTYALVSVNLISLLSLMGVFAISVKPRTLSRITFYLVSLAAGCMLGQVFVHLIPESFENVASGQITSLNLSLLMVAGFVGCFLLEKLMHNHGHCPEVCGFVHEVQRCDHCDEPEPDHHDDHHEESSGHIHPLGHMSLLAHVMDNFNDGVLIGITYMVSIPAGIATTIAIVSHEIPMEFGGFGVLVKYGFTRWQAIAVNFLSGVIALIGTILVLYFGTIIHNLPVYLSPLGAGVVAYIATIGLIPQLKNEPDKGRSLRGLLVMGFGLAVMIGAKLIDVG